MNCNLWIFDLLSTKDKGVFILFLPAVYDLDKGLYLCDEGDSHLVYLCLFGNIKFVVTNRWLYFGFEEDEMWAGYCDNVHMYFILLCLESDEDIVVW